MPYDGRGKKNSYYQSPSITSNELFYISYDGNKRPANAKPLPEEKGETIERHFYNKGKEAADYKLVPK